MQNSGSTSDFNKKPSLDEVLAQVPARWRSALMDEATNLHDDLQKLFFLKVQSADEIHYPIQVQAFRREGYSTYSLKVRAENGALTDVGTVQFAPLFNGSYLIRRTLLATMQVVTYTEQYDENGIYQGRYHDPSPNLLYVNLTEMEPRCPVISHLYNLLLYEYQQAETGQANSLRIRQLERVLRTTAEAAKTDATGIHDLSFRSKPFDLAVQMMNVKIAENELDPALTFADKGAVRANLKRERATILRVKKRVHGVHAMPLRMRLVRSDIAARWLGIQKRPVEKSLGTLHKYTVGVFAWFFGIVRNNIGYSVALAIYAPFTFYFITQPMNPGAMWTVGKVRKTYLNTVEMVQGIPLIGALAGGAPDAPEKLVVESGQSAKYDPRTPYEKVKPKFENFLVATDVPAVNQQGWADRMSNFKQMQITYESNLQFSQRMGRLEQMENQLNFPLIAESSYRELDVSLQRVQDLGAILKSRGMITPEIITYLTNETHRARQFKLYIWDKMVRYMLDHPYIVLDEAKEHTFVDYYIGRNFIFLEEITKDLAKQYPGFMKPEGFGAIEKLAKFYRQKKVDAPTVEGRLEKNSYLHKLDGVYDGAQMRANLKRQWEILYLSYNRSQEASNFGLQLYVWSVRNSIWALGALTGAKNREFELLTRDLEHGDRASVSLARYGAEREKIESLYESLFHIQSLEYVSIREELNGKLEKDLESTQRQAVLESLRASFRERTAFLGSLK